MYKSDLFKSIGSGYLLFFATNIVALFLTPFLLRYITKEEYGFYILCVELLTWIGFMNLGTAKVLGPKVAKELGENNSSEILFLFNSSLWFQLFVSFLAIPLYYGLVIVSGVESSGVENYSGLILLFAFAAFANNLSGQFSEMIIATRKIHLDNRIQMLMLILRLSLIVGLIPVFGFETVFLVYFVIAILDVIRKAYRVRNLYPELRIKTAYYSQKHLKELLSTGLFFTVASLTTILVTKLDQFFLGREVGLQIVASYYVSIKLIQMGEKFVAILFNNLRPHVSRLYGESNMGSIEKIYMESSGLMMIILSVFFLVLSEFNSVFVSSWVGSEMFLGEEFTTYFLLFTGINLLLIPSRIVLISTLNFIKEASIIGLVQGLLRIVLLIFGFKVLDILALPVSNLVAVFLTTFFYQLTLTASLFKKSNDVIGVNRVMIVVVMAALVSVMLGVHMIVSVVFMFFGGLFVFRKVSIFTSELRKLLLS